MDETIIKSIRVPLSFEEAFNYDLKIKQITEQIKKNDAEFENGRKNRPVFLLLTKKYIEFEKELSRYISNPFLPQHFTSILKNIQVDIEYNINIMIKELLLRYYTSLCEQEPKGDTKISCTPLFNQFNRLKKPHKPDINRLIDNIRKLMLIDHKW
jgi:hypothetical protein